MHNSQMPKARKSGIVTQEMDGEMLVYDLDADKAHCLNETSYIVWNSCDGNTSISDISAILSKATGKGVSDDIVWLAIDQLGENGLLADKIETKFAGESRRTVLKKIGFAAAVGLPVIASLVAPKNAWAVGSCSCGSNPAICQTLTSCPSTTNCNGSGICAP